MAFVNTTLSVDFVMQTLGGIVQAYASILAIGGAFYIFLIERILSDFQETEENLDNALLSMNRKWGSLEKNFIKTKTEGLGWFLEILRECPKVVRNSDEASEVVYHLPKYQQLKKRTGAWGFKYFSEFFFLYTVVLMASIIEMFFISLFGLTFVFLLIFTGITIISLLGFFTFIIACKNIVNVSQEVDSPQTD